MSAGKLYSLPSRTSGAFVEEVPHIVPVT